MNTPNKLTLIRLAMIPVIVAVLCLGRYERTWLWVACALFIIASLTDLLDGQLARRCNQVTNFGKFMDPLADKTLVCAVLIALIEWGLVPAWAVIIIVFREFAISGVRLVASERGVVLAASLIAKIKTNVQMFWVIAVMLHLSWSFWGILTDILMWGSVILTVVSFADYILKNKQILKEGL